MKKDQLVFWISTGILFLWEGILPAFTSHTQLAVEGIRHLGYPDYFRIYLTVCKVIGTLALILPAVPGRVKEWAYAGVGIVLVSAFVSHLAIDGLHFFTFLPVPFLILLVLSYRSYHRLQTYRALKTSIQL